MGKKIDVIKTIEPNTSKRIEPNTRKTIEPNAGKTIDPNASNTIENIASKKKEITRNQIAFNPHLKSYLDNLPTTSLKSPFGENTTK